jgi:hypothetical protein
MGMLVKQNLQSFVVGTVNGASCCLLSRLILRMRRKSDAAIPVISKKGKADLRYALYQAALIASVRVRRFMVYFTNRLQGREREPAYLGSNLQNSKEQVKCADSVPYKRSWKCLLKLIISFADRNSFGFQKLHKQKTAVLISRTWSI